MTDFFLFCFASIGMTLILVRGSIFLPVRRYFVEKTDRIHRRRQKKGLPPGLTTTEFLHDLIHCVQCMGFWCGLFCGFFLLTSDGYWMRDFGLRFVFNRSLMLFCCGAAGSFLSSVADIFLEWLFFSKILRERTVIADDRRRVQEESTVGHVDPDLSEDA